MTRHDLLARAGVGAIALLTMLSGCASDPAGDAIRPSSTAAGSTTASMSVSPVAQPAGTPSRFGAAAAAPGGTADRPGLGAAAVGPFPGDARLSARGKATLTDRTIDGTIAVAAGLSLTDGWYHATDTWSDEEAPPAAVKSEAHLSVSGLQPGLVVAYQIVDAKGPTGVWIGAKFFSPATGTNAWECVVYRGNPLINGRADDGTAYTCEWTDYRGWKPAPRLTIALWKRTGPIFPGDADIVVQHPKYASDSDYIGVIRIDRGHLGRGWYFPTDNWSSTTAPPLTVDSSIPARFQLRGQGPGLVLAYRIYDSSGAATKVWIGAKLYLPKVGNPSWECKLYTGSPTVTGRVTLTSGYSCTWTPGSAVNPNWILTVSGVR